jgi:hypothetical protein
LPGSFKWSLAFRHHHQIPACIWLLVHLATCPTHLILNDWITQIFGEEYK